MNIHSFEIYVLFLCVAVSPSTCNSGLPHFLLGIPILKRACRNYRQYSGSQLKRRTQYFAVAPQEKIIFTQYKVIYNLISMKPILINIAIISILSIILYVEVGHAKPFGNRWNPTDTRCGGGFFPGIRLKRSVTSHNYEQFYSYYKFNPNLGTCEQMSGSKDADYQAFTSKSECERNCLNIYHFS